jgi:hypothetical protein
MQNLWQLILCLTPGLAEGHAKIMHLGLYERTDILQYPVGTTKETFDKGG